MGNKLYNSLFQSESDIHREYCYKSMLFLEKSQLAKKYNLSLGDKCEIVHQTLEEYINRSDKEKKGVGYFKGILKNILLSLLEKDIEYDQKKVSFDEQIDWNNNTTRDYINEQISIATDLLKVSQEKLNNLVHRMIQDNNLPKHCTKILEAIFNKLKEGKEYNEISNKELAEQLDFTLNYLRSRKSYCLQETKKQYINDPIIQELYYQ